MIYVVDYKYNLIGYFTTRKEAESYIIAHRDKGLTVSELKCLEKVLTKSYRYHII